MAKKADEVVDKTDKVVETTEEKIEENTADEVAKTEKEEKFAKSGKRSKKHIEEVEAEAARQARKAEVAAKPEKKAGPKPITRSRLERRGKNYRKLAEKIEKNKVYSLKDAVELAIVSLPNGTGKTVRVAVFAPLDLAKKAKEAGADIAEDEDFLKLLDKEKLDFDVLISTPQYMPKLGKYARLLGPKGLMPNPKAGTVTNDIEKAVQEAKAGKIEYRVDKQGIVHVGVGKVSFDADKLIENLNVFLDSLKSQKPASLKGQYVKSIYLSTTMGPSIQVENTLN